LLLLLGFPAWSVRPAAEAALDRVVLVFFDCARALPAADFALLLAPVDRSVLDAAFAAFLDVFLLMKLII